MWHSETMKDLETFKILDFVGWISAVSFRRKSWLPREVSLVSLRLEETAEILTIIACQDKRCNFIGDKRVVTIESAGEILM